MLQDVDDAGMSAGADHHQPAIAEAEAGSVLVLDAHERTVFALATPARHYRARFRGRQRAGKSQDRQKEGRPILGL